MAGLDSRARPTLSVAMVVRDEAEVLEAGIESVRSIADEILVLDTGSIDGTPALARQLGAKVCEMPWRDDFSAARNRLLDEAAGDWILWLDGGERLTEESAAPLQAFVEADADADKIYTLWIEIPPARPDGSAEQAVRPRLMPGRPELRFRGRVCETVDPSREAAGLPIDAAPGRIVRSGRQHDPRHKAKVAARNLRLVQLDSAERGRNPRLILAAANAYNDTGDKAAAQAAYAEVLETARHGSPEMLEGYYGLLATLGGDPAEQDRQVAVCLEALEVFPLDAQLLVAMGSYLQRRGRLELAARAFQAAAACGQVNVEAWHLREIAQVATACLALVLELQGKDDEARRVLVEGLAGRPGSERLRRRLLNLHVKHARMEEALRLADQLVEEPDRREALRHAVRGACHAAGWDWATALGHLESARAAGCDDPLCFRWLALGLLTGGRDEAARSVIRQWLRRDPHDAEARKYLAAAGESPPEPAIAGVDDAEAHCLRIDAGRQAGAARPFPPSARPQSQSAPADRSR